MILCSLPRLTNAEKNKIEEICKNEEIYYEKDISTADIPFEKVEVFITFGYDIDSELINKMQSLRWISIFQTGTEHLPIEEILAKDILLTHIKDIHGIPISEYVLSMILYVIRHIPRYVASKEAGFWDRRNYFVEEAAGKTVSIFGTGSIGGAIAKTLKSLNMNIIGVNTKGSPQPYFDEVYTLNNKHLVLERSDFVVLVLPLTKETQKCIGRKEFEKMKESCYLINVGRGQLMDTEVLIEYLSKKKIRGAALDVFDVEPLPKDHLLWNLNNVIITPHIASMTDKYNERCIEKFEINYKSYKSGLPMNYEIVNIDDY